MIWFRQLLILRWCAGVFAWQCLPGAGVAGTPANSPSVWDVAGPARVTGTVYEIGSRRQTVLYHFSRTATRSGASVRVERQFTAPNGSVAAVENVYYQSNQLVSYELREFQAHLSGAIEIAPDPAQPGQSRIRIGYAQRLVPPTGEWQPLKPDTLIDDDLYPFLLAHWAELMRGESVRFRFVSIEWRCTFNFRLVKIGETVAGGRACEQIAMKPSGFFLSQVVKPLVFTVEKAPPHLMLSYLGRTTPRVQRDGAWKYLDAETVFDVDQLTPANP